MIHLIGVGFVLMLLQGTPPYPQFARILQLEATPDTSANVSIGDVNADGHPDLLLVKGRHWPGMSRIMLGDGRGHFSTSWDLGESRYRSYSGRLVDIDRDGDLDVVLSNDAPDPKVIFANDGTGHFTPAGSFGEPSWGMRNAAIADLNGDGLPDIVPAIRSDHPTQYVCLTSGGGRDCRPFSNASATTITPADLNHDGWIDLVVPHRDEGQSLVYLNGGKGDFSAGRAIPFGPKDAAIRMAEVADLDRDGRLDIVVIDERRGAGIYFGRADGTYSAVVPLADGKVTPYALAVADLNRDGAPDIVVGNVEAPTTIHYNDGSGRRFTKIHAGDSRGAVYGFGIGDLDGDGWVDIAVARSEAPSLVMFGGMSTEPAEAPQGQAVRDGYIATADSVRIYYRVVGAGSDTVVVLHGGPGFTMDYLLPDLVPMAERHTMLFYDQRGSGRSTAPLDSFHISVAQHVADLEALRGHFGIARLTLLGHSWGGKLAAIYAAAHPDRVKQLILEAPGSPKPDPRFGRNLLVWADSGMRARIDQLSRTARDSTTDRIESCRAFWKEFIRGYWFDANDTTSMRRMRGDVCSYPGAMNDLARVGQLTATSAGRHDYAADVSAVRVPVLVVVGRNDPMPWDNSQAWAAAFPDSRLLILERSGHFPHVEEPEAFFEAVEAFLRGSWPASAVKVARPPQ
jgi:proline-specific peptidase